MSDVFASGEERRNDLFMNRKNGYDCISEEDLAAIDSYCDGYKKFLTASKTEREAVENAITIIEAAGFKPLKRGTTINAGDKVYRSIHGKAILMAIIGTENLANGVNIGAAHIDSPRLDIKPNPLYEDSDIALLKTHYYGGIRKYQWLSIPLELHGVVVLKNGRTVKIKIGGESGDPYITIPDLLPHLAAKQNAKPVATAFDPEHLNIFVGTKPYPDVKVADRFKLMVLDILNKKYGIVEEDFLSAELCAVPGYDAVDVGLDHSMIGGYGQDDAVCAYAAMLGLLDAKQVKKTGVVVLADKEEIGSMGISGMQSHAFETFIEDLCKAEGIDINVCLENSFCLSADVTACYDPNFANVYDKKNASIINRGVGLCKYTGSRGKSGSNDASAEVMGYVRSLFNDNAVIWHVSELGKVDEGGGGTVALYMANRNIETVDAGVPVLGMHAPFEVTSKLDCYMTYKAMRVLFES